MIGYFIDPFSRTVEARGLPDDAPDTVQKLEAIYALLQSDALEAIQPGRKRERRPLLRRGGRVSKPDQRTFVCRV